MKHPLHKPDTLPAREKKRLLETAKSALAFYLRETDPVTYADPGKPEIFSLERGLQVALFPMLKEKQLALESYIGYMVFKNGFPVSYGGGWLFGLHCTIGIHIFPAFRQAESGWIFCQVLRVYHGHYGATCFHIKPYQFGYRNPEGIRSGAYWFYYKLGFRSQNQELRIKAAKEQVKIESGTATRTAKKQLQEFARSGLVLDLGKTAENLPIASEISISVSQFINRHFEGSRPTAVNTLMPELLLQPQFRLLGKK